VKSWQVEVKGSPSRVIPEITSVVPDIANIVTTFWNLPHYRAAAILGSGLLVCWLLYLHCPPLGEGANGLALYEEARL
jgi:hypothetical protein